MEVEKQAQKHNTETKQKRPRTKAQKHWQRKCAFRTFFGLRPKGGAARKKDVEVVLQVCADMIY